jgi:hypothetical protein
MTGVFTDSLSSLVGMVLLGHIFKSLIVVMCQEIQQWLNANRQVTSIALKGLEVLNLSQSYLCRHFKTCSNFRQTQIVPISTVATLISTKTQFLTFSLPQSVRNTGVRLEKL